MTNFFREEDIQTAVNAYMTKAGRPLASLTGVQITPFMFTTQDSIITAVGGGGSNYYDLKNPTGSVTPPTINGTRYIYHGTLDVVASITPPTAVVTPWTLNVAYQFPDQLTGGIGNFSMYITQSTVVTQFSINVSLINPQTLYSLLFSTTNNAANTGNLIVSLAFNFSGWQLSF